MSLQVKAIAAAILLLLLGLGAYLAAHAVYSAGEAATQIKWDKDKLTQQAAYEKRLSDLSAQLAMTQKANEGIHEYYDSKLAQAESNASVFASELRNATLSLNTATGTLSKVGNLLGSATASQQDSAERLGQLLGLISDFHTESVKNAARLDALVMEAKPQT